MFKSIRNWWNKNSLENLEVDLAVVQAKIEFEESLPQIYPIVLSDLKGKEAKIKALIKILKRKLGE